MKKTILTRVLALIGAVIAVVSAVIVPTFAETDVLTDDNHYGVGIWDYDTDQVLVDAYNGAMDYTFVESLSQIFFNLFPLSDIKTIIPVERYTTDENGKHSIVQAPLPVDVPLSFSLNDCAVMAIRINISGTMYGMWSYAENFEVVTDTNLYGYVGDGIIDEPGCSQHIEVNYDVISFGDSILPDLEQYYPKDSAWMNRYWDKAEHLEYRGGFSWNIGNALLTEYAYDTMREYDANSKNYTLAYAVVSLEDFSVYNHKESALQEGYNLGYNEGHTVGYDDGVKAGESLHANDYQNGYGDGYTEGEAVGWQNGEAHGITETQNTVKGVKNVVFAIFDAPVRLIDGMLDFELFGINLSATVKVIITLAVVAAIVAAIMKFVKG